jgi:hypothetical protein
MPVRFSGQCVSFTAPFLAVLFALGSIPGAFADSEVNADTPEPAVNLMTYQAEGKPVDQKSESGNEAVNKKLGEHYGLLKTNKATTMERELNAAGSAGYHVVNVGAFQVMDGSVFGGPKTTFLLERSEPPGKYEYRIWADGGSISLNGMGNKMAQKLQSRLNHEAIAGFRLLPACTFARETPAGFPADLLVTGSSEENMICMERPAPLPSKHYEYQVVHDGGLKNLHEKAEPLLRQGYAIVAFDQTTTNFAILERLSDGGPQSTATQNFARPYLVLGTNRVSSMLKDVNEKAKAHYRLRDVCFSISAHRVVLEQEDNSEGIYEYEAVSFGDKEFEQKIAENGKHGFRVYPRTMNTDLIMEKAPGSDAQYLYVLVQGKTLQDVFAKIDEEKQKGFKLFGLVGNGILLERTTPAGEHAAEPASQ